MTREEVIKRLQPHEARLRQGGVTALYLFGSTARNEAGPNSDVDIACDIDEDKQLSLLDFIGLQQDVARILKRRRVDFLERRLLRPRIKARVEQELVRVF